MCYLSEMGYQNNFQIELKLFPTLVKFSTIFHLQRIKNIQNLSIFQFLGIPLWHCVVKSIIFMFLFCHSVWVDAKFLDGFTSTYPSTFSMWLTKYTYKIMQPLHQNHSSWGILRNLKPDSAIFYQFFWNSMNLGRRNIRHNSFHVIYCSTTTIN